MELVKKVAYTYGKFEEHVLVASLVFTVTIVFYQIIMRFVFNDSPSWTEETCRYVFIWQIWIGACAGVKEGNHIRLDLMGAALKKRSHFLANNILELIVLLIWISLCIFLLIGGVDMCLQMASRNAVSPGLRLPEQYIFAALPVSCGIVVLRLAALIVIEAQKVLKGGVE